MLCMLLFILGVFLYFVARKLGPILACIEEERRNKKVYQKVLLDSVQNIENTLVPKEDKIAETVQAIKDIQAKKTDREAVDDLIDNL